MAKVLITLLGTGRYAKGDEDKNEYVGTDYIINSKIYPDKKFVSSAIIEHYGIDKTYIIGTSKSMWDNIAVYFGADDDYVLELLEKKESETLRQKHLDKLTKIIDRKLQAEGSHCIIVQEGEDQDELLKIFDKFLEILENVDENDTLFFDITHLFRSVSVMSLILAEMAHIQEIEIGGIFYGMLAKDAPSKIIDVKIFLEFLEWTKAIKNLKEYGDSIALQRLIDKSSLDKEIKNNFTNFSNALSIADIGALQRAIKQLHGNLEVFTKAENRFIKLISKDLQEFVNHFESTFTSNSFADFQFKLAKWHKDNYHYALFYIVLAEAIISAVCEKNRFDPTNRDDREKAKKILSRYRSRKKYPQSLNIVGEIYKKIKKIRNAIAHNSSAESSPTESIKNMQKYYNILYTYYTK